MQDVDMNEPLTDVELEEFLNNTDWHIQSEVIDSNHISKSGAINETYVLKRFFKSLDPPSSAKRK